MIRSLWQYVLVGLMVLGLWRLVQDRRELKGLRTEANRLAAKVGEIDLEDPSRIHVVSVPEDRPNEFAWRVFLPAEHAWAIHQYMGSGGSSSHHQSASSSPNDMLVQFRMTETESGWSTFIVHDSGTNSSSMPKELGAFLDEHWSELKIAIAGFESELTLETDQVLTLLRVEVPEELIELAEAKLNRYQAQRLRDDPLIKIEIGSDQAFARRAEQAKQGREELPR